MAKASSLKEPLHPYYPLEVEIVGYLANEYDVPTLLASFAGGCVLIFAVTLAIVTRLHSGLRGADKATILWFTLCGFIHLFFEGYFALNHQTMGPSQNLFGQMWKEYSLSDSRYLTSDPFVLCMESITAICWGPLSFALIALITTDHPLRHPIQIIVSLGQLYGDVLYYGTALFDHYYKGLTYSRPEAYYFWGYYVAINFIWVVIPCILIYNSITACAKAFKALDKASKTLHANGSAKKSN
ncbi:MAG: hypothetical protein M1824_001191 [Vezdaea acicularis]|nr:MAG: hypothetical protein M1824_001191 [Vezdaea acicularis]